MGKLSKEMINHLIKIKTNAIVREIGSKVAEEDLTFEIEKLYSSKTFAYLQDSKSGFCIKSVAELLYLIEKEYDGDWKAWEYQAF